MKSADVELIFGNIESILEFHQGILQKLSECAIDRSRPETRFHEWSVSSVFIGSIPDFVHVYSVYCNQYHDAVCALRSLQNKKTVLNLLEA